MNRKTEDAQSHRSRPPGRESFPALCAPEEMSPGSGKKMQWRPVRFAAQNKPHHHGITPTLGLCAGGDVSLLSRRRKDLVNGGSSVKAVSPARTGVLRPRRL
jgi:hypothetical protein